MYPFVYMKNDIVLNKKKKMFLFLRNLKQLNYKQDLFLWNLKQFNYKQDFVCFNFLCILEFIVEF